MSKHQQFILTPITTVLNDAIVASYGIGKGIETHSLSLYIIEALFLKMTGFQEQKFKAIAWEMATNDLDYRNTLLSHEDNLGDYSTYRAKNAIFQRFQEVICRIKQDFDLTDWVNDHKLRNRTLEDIQSLFWKTNLAIWHEKQFQYFCQAGQDIFSLDQLLPAKEAHQATYQLLGQGLQNQHQTLHQHRTHLVANAIAYQEKSPSLESLHDKSEETRNYFIWFALLLLIDYLLISIYQGYQTTLEENSY